MQVRYQICGLSYIYISPAGEVLSFLLIFSTNNTKFSFSTFAVPPSLIKKLHPWVLYLPIKLFCPPTIFHPYKHWHCFNLHRQLLH